MRISADQIDPGYRYDWACHRVWFSGVEIARWITADEERCLVHVHQSTPAGEPAYGPDGQPRIVIRHGQVRVEAPASLITGG